MRRVEEDLLGHELFVHLVLPDEKGCKVQKYQEKEHREGLEDNRGLIVVEDDGEKGIEDEANQEELGENPTKLMDASNTCFLPGRRALGSSRQRGRIKHVPRHLRH